ncbi:MAG: MotA/TolQ/ExbB proton channel family protein [Thermodesulfobacteriota bacterium]
MDIATHSGFWGMIQQATVVVQFVLALLAAMSVTSWAIIFYKIVQLTQAKRKVRQEAEQFANARDLATAMQQLKRNQGSALYTVGYEAISELHRLERSSLQARQKAEVAADNIRRVLRRGVSKRMNDYAKNLSFLATCGNSAPFIGLFGTVWGIMHAFQSIGLEQTAALAAVAPGISEALVATAIGLAVAIPATIAYNSFLGLLNGVESEMVNFAGSFLNRAQREVSWLSRREVRSSEGDDQNEL